MQASTQSERRFMVGSQSKFLPDGQNGMAVGLCFSPSAYLQVHYLYIPYTFVSVSTTLFLFGFDIILLSL